MDEPLSNLDAKLRVDMRAELARLHDRLGITTVYVTHDQVEAMTLGSRVAVMRDGTVQQVDTPQTLYREPMNLFVAAFIGSPSMNLVEAELNDGVALSRASGFRSTADRRPTGADGARDPRHQAPGLRRTRARADPALPRIEVEAAVVEELGSATHVLFTIEAPPVDVESVRAATDEGERASLLATDRRALFTAEVAEETRRAPRRPDRARGRPDSAALLRPRDGQSLRSGSGAAQTVPA